MPVLIRLNALVGTVTDDYVAQEGEVLLPLPEGFDLSRPDAIAEVIEQALRESGIPAEASDVLSHLKIELPTAQLGAASRALAEMRLI